MGKQIEKLKDPTNFAKFKLEFPEYLDFIEKKEKSRLNAQGKWVSFSSFRGGKIFLLFGNAGEKKESGNKLPVTADDFKAIMEEYGEVAKEEEKKDELPAEDVSKKAKASLPEADKLSIGKVITKEEAAALQEGFVQVAKNEEEREKVKSQREEPGKAQGDQQEVKLEEKDEELEKLRQAVANARNTYAAKDYEISNSLAKIKDILGGNLKFAKDEEIATQEYFAKYKNTLQELLNYKIEKLKEEKLPSGEDGKMMELMKYFNQEEKVNLFEAHTNARALSIENKFGKTSGRVVEYCGKSINWYRKLNWKYKIAMAGIMMAAGATAALTAPVGAAGIAAYLSLARGVQRGLGSAAAGVGMTAMMEARYRKKEDSRLGGQRENIKEELEVNPEEKFERLMQKMEEEIDGYKESLKTEKQKARNRKWLGVGTGAVFLRPALPRGFLARADGGGPGGQRPHIGCLMFDRHFRWTAADTESRGALGEDEMRVHESPSPRGQHDVRGAASPSAA